MNFFEDNYQNNTLATLNVVLFNIVNNFITLCMYFFIFELRYIRIVLESHSSHSFIQKQNWNRYFRNSIIVFKFLTSAASLLINSIVIFSKGNIPYTNIQFEFMTFFRFSFVFCDIAVLLFFLPSLHFFINKSINNDS